MWTPLTIQDASDYVKELFKARGKSIRRIASASNYNSMQKGFRGVRPDSSGGQRYGQSRGPAFREEYLFDFIPVIALEIEKQARQPGGIRQHPGRAGESTSITFTGQPSLGTGNALFVFSPEDIDQAVKIFKE